MCRPLQEHTVAGHDLARPYAAGIKRTRYIADVEDIWTTNTDVVPEAQIAAAVLGVMIERFKVNYMIPPTGDGVSMRSPSQMVDARTLFPDGLEHIG